MGELTVDLVAVDKPLWTGAATMVSAMTSEGDIGILPGHEPVLALLRDGAVTIKTTDGQVLLAAVHEGFFSVDSDHVVILADAAELGQDIDLERAKAALARAQAGSLDDSETAAAARRAETRIRVAEEAGAGATLRR